MRHTVSHVRQYPNTCMDTDNDKHSLTWPADAVLPPTARLPINRCNLPAVILGSVTFQRHPVPLYIDGVRELHGDFFRMLGELDSPEERAVRFRDYMMVRFCLNALDEAGYDPDSTGDRPKADYRRLLLGWMFDSDSRDGAVLKGWVESRFGLITRFHRVLLESPESDAYQRFTHERSLGLYNTNALEAQLDLLYAYCQYELHHCRDEEHLTLYRGVTRTEGLGKAGGRQGQVVLLNNISSFSENPDRASEFGDVILKARVPREKIAFYNELLPGMLSGEQEYGVIGGLYEVSYGA
jgi:NAD+--dinitrogen-reductase ADP-D-ribosyltransferase